MSMRKESASSTKSSFIYTTVCIMIITNEILGENECSLQKPVVEEEESEVASTNYVNGVAVNGMLCTRR